ncbi:DUF305 domain-containing protein [Ornithinimicrobium cavernae]|uniref:DUF305 domain-containing protein n=1 Tax=Ornithinimicrobium cavernae TaxID=2666047 RepID=UPI00137968A3|nr:DUF305 domain-containing protein [Ornithinimicrobium cavernae]
MQVRHVLPSTLVLSVALLTGCSGDETGEVAPTSPTARLLQGAAPGEANQTLTAMPEIDVPEPTEADVEFVHMMLPHHAQALEMTALVPSRTSREDVPLFAERIELSQADEIELMVRWLQTHDLPVPAGFDASAQGGHEAHSTHTGGHGAHVDMPGLLTPEQLEQLAAAEGEAFDRLFLEFMHYHHDGALQMVQDLRDRGGGQEPELAMLVNHIDSDQRIEMDRMESMLAEIGSG